MKKDIYIYKGFERFWHWAQSALIIFLAFTGFEIHGTFSYFGYERAVEYHNYSAYSLVILTAFAVFWHLTTGEYKQYIPTFKKLKEQVLYYVSGIFKGEPHPTHKTELSKLNPLQRFVYLGLKVFIIPPMILSGLLYMYYRYVESGTVLSLNTDSLEWIALLHTAGAFALVSFLVVHVYLITTGETITSNLKAMITGYEEIEEQEEVVK